MNSLIRKELHNGIQSHLSPYLEKCHRFYFCDDDDLIELHVKEDEKDTSERIIIRVYISDGGTQVHIPNISLPVSWRGNRLGMRLIEIVYRIARGHGYALFITNLTNSFFEYLAKCGAHVTDGDTVEITDRARLT